MEFPQASRNTDPSTSHEAECRITDIGIRASQCRALYDAIVQTPGYTAVELSREYGFERHMVSKRTADLCSKRLVTKGDIRKCLINGTNMVTWYPVYRTPEQEDLFS